MAGVGQHAAEVALTGYHHPMDHMAQAAAKHAQTHRRAMYGCSRAHHALVHRSVSSLLSRAIVLSGAGTSTTPQSRTRKQGLRAHRSGSPVGA
jgi:hypothetical protein